MALTSSELQTLLTCFCELTEELLLHTQAVVMSENSDDQLVGMSKET